ncbi:hypothetical protein [Corynebacterium cystitidis]|uniref:hypothetical protein n=1 Tax=Corynebacterium cystitidis TaxID=35757 RepID=UPI00211E6E63|nr:hypothetical protein [Corynebacterium cystitidis]
MRNSNQGLRTEGFELRNANRAYSQTKQHQAAPSSTQERLVSWLEWRTRTKCVILEHMGEKFSGEYILSQFVSTRSHAFRVGNRFADPGDKLVKVSTQWALPSFVVEGMPWYQRRWATAVAHGRSGTSRVLMGRSAGRVLGMWVIGTWPNEVVEIATPNMSPPPKHKWAPGAVQRKAQLAQGDVVVKHDVRVTSPVRTAVDIARLHGFREGLVALDWLLRSTKYSKQNVAACINSLGRAKGINTARRCLKYAVDTSESPYESFARAILIEAGLVLRTQEWVLGGVRTDLFTDPSVCVEVDGDGKYKDTPGLTIQEERARERRMLNAGFAVVRTTPKELHQVPAKFVDDVRRAIARQQRAA